MENLIDRYLSCEDRFSLAQILSEISEVYSKAADVLNNPDSAENDVFNCLESIRHSADVINSDRRGIGTLMKQIGI